MDGLMYLKFISAFVFVIALMAGLGVVLRRWGAEGTLGKLQGRRLRVVEFTSLDARHKLVLVRRDDVEHLLLLGAQSEVVVESGIPAKTLSVVKEEQAA